MNISSQFLFAIPVFLGSILCLLFIINGFSNQKYTAAKSFIALMAFAFLYSFFYGLELLSDTIEQKKLFLTLQYSGALAISPQFWWFTRSYASKTRSTYLAPWFLFIFPFILFVFLLFDSNLNLFYSNLKLEQLPTGDSFLSHTNGVLFYLHNAYSLIFVVASIYQLVLLYLSVPQLYKKQVLGILLGFGVAVIGFLLALLEIFPSYIDPVPLSFVVSGTILFFSITQFAFFKEQPIAFETLFNNLKDAVIVFNNEGQVLHKNPSAIALMQYTGIQDAQLNQLCSLEHLTLVDGKAQLNKEKEELFLKDRWYRLEHSELLKKNKKEGHIYLIRDITQRKQSEIQARESNKRLIRSEQEFRLLVESSRDLIFKVNPLGKVTYLSPVFKSMFGRSESTQINRPFFEMVYPVDQFKVKDLLNHMLVDGLSESELSYRIQKENGNLRWHQTVFVAEKNDEDQIIGVFGTSKDVSERKNAEIALIQSEREAKRIATQYETVLNNQSVYFIRLDTAGQVTFANSFFTETIGNGIDFIGSPFNKISNPKNLEEINNAIDFCLKNPNVEQKIIIQQIEKGKLIRGSKWELKGLPNRFNRVIEILGVGVDITEQLNNLSKSQDLLHITQKQNERLRSFTYIVSHNIRSHSANFSGLLNLTLSEATSTTDKLEMLPLLKETAERLEETLFNLNDVLTIQDDLNHHKIWKNLYATFQETLSILKNNIEDKEASIAIDMDTNIEVLAIPAYLESVLLNLLSNALRYRDTSRPLEVKITAEKTNEGVCVSVADNGLGIDLDRYKEKMFGLYKTFHGNEDAKGVGLFLVKAQMQAMGGTITVESTVGKGSVFHVFFPSTKGPNLETIQKA